MKVALFTIMLLVIGVLVIGFQSIDGNSAQRKGQSDTMAANSGNKNLETATLAGGCFWCLESDMEKLSGVKEAVSGYTGGSVDNPTYDQVSGGGTGHVEAVQVVFDPNVISYKDLLREFWKVVDPTDAGGQFVDRGSQYATGVFYHDEKQRAAAMEVKNDLDSSGRFKKPIVTPLKRFTKFYRAEEYHQDYYKNHGVRYKFYRLNSGRDQFIKKIWGKKDKSSYKKRSSSKYSKPADSELRAKLSSMQYKVTQKEGTEPPYKNEYWDNKKAGIYVDVVSGEPLFSSLDKYDSRTGWPSFTRPLEPGHIVEKKDRRLFSVRIEARSKYGDSHLGHVFPDGPAPTGLRYCINSSALRFIPVEDLENKGYGQYRANFK